MAPTPYPENNSLAQDAEQRLPSPPVKRIIADSTLISIIIPVVILSIITIAATSFFVRRAWKTVVEARCAKGDQEATTPPPLAERRQDDWARKNSNVLWSMYINDDDLRAQFSKPPKDSRLFSIGSVSTVGPLDAPAGRPSIVVEHDEKPAMLHHEEETKHKVSKGRGQAQGAPRRATVANDHAQKGNGQTGSESMYGRRTSLTTA